MPSPVVLYFPPFALDVGNEQLWHGDQLLPLRPKPFAILRYLVENAGRLVTKEELLKTVWPQTYVSEGLLHTYLRDLRYLLNDDPEAPRFIETVVRRGYRFIAPLIEEKAPEFTPSIVMHGETARATFPVQTPIASSLPSLVGREVVLTSLHDRLTQALKGVRQLVFVTGEPGIGKTTLVDAFLEQVSARQNLWIGRGQCVAQYGVGEAYLPVLEALSRLGREPGRGRLLPLLRQYAPSWMVQLPGLLKDGEHEALQRTVQGVTRERMLREIIEALEALTAEQPLVLVLEDLHWCDASTLDWLSAIAQRRESARLLVLGTYRPADVIVSGHPLRAVKQELDLHGQCTELPLAFLTPNDVTQYLSVRFLQHDFPKVFGQRLQQHTEGNPLFVVTTLEDLVTRQVIGEQDSQWQLQVPLDDVALGVSCSVQQLIIRQLERLSGEEQRIVEVASVAGESFSAAAVAAGLAVDLDQVETCCESLARREQFLRAQELTTWPDGTIAGRYGFVHAFYQQVLYERIGAARRVQLHRRIGEREEIGYGNRASEIATELAVHFEQGRDTRRAIQYLQHAAQAASGRSANREAATHLTKALELLKTLPDTPERIPQELDLQMALGTTFMAIKGYGALEVENSYARAQELSRGIEEAPRLASLFYGLWVFHLVRGELQTAHKVAQQFMRLAQRVQDPTLQMEAHHAFGQILHFMGDFPSALTHLEQNLALYNPRQHAPAVRRNVQDLGVMGRCYAAESLWFLGYPDQALTRSDEALVLAREIAHPFSLAFALSTAARVRLYRQEWQPAQEWTETLTTFATQQGFSLFVMIGIICRGQALTEQRGKEEGIAQLRRGLAAYGAAGAKLGQPRVLSVLGKAYGKVGRPEEGLNSLAEALMITDKCGDRRDEAEIYRLKGQLTLQKFQVPSSKFRGEKDLKSKAQSPRSAKPKSQRLNPNPSAEAEVEEYFLKAIEVAHKQQAKSLELRAVTSLSQLWQSQGKQKEAHRMLSEIYGWFTEGFDTKDLQEAKALLEELT